jgi:hypothetical protein
MGMEGAARSYGLPEYRDGHGMMYRLTLPEGFLHSSVPN